MTAPQGSNGYLVYSPQMVGAVNIRNYNTSSRVLPGLISPPANSLGALRVPGHSSDHIVHNGAGNRMQSQCQCKSASRDFCLHLSDLWQKSDACYPMRAVLCLNILPTIPLDQEVVLVAPALERYTHTHTDRDAGHP